MMSRVHGEVACAEVGNEVIIRKTCAYAHARTTTHREREREEHKEQEEENDYPEWTFPQRDPSNCDDVHVQTEEDENGLRCDHLNVSVHPLNVQPT